MKLLPYIPITLFFLFLGFTACNEQRVDTRPQELSDGSVRIVTYDSCEYIIVGGGHSRWGSHKGDCKNPIHHNNLNDSTNTLSPFTGQNW